MISVCEHEKAMKMQKPVKTHANLNKSELTTAAYYEASEEALGDDLDVKMAQKELQECSQVQNDDPSKCMAKLSKNILLSS